MPIEIRCENVAGFDAALGTYQNCGQLLRVPEKYAGKSVKCPKCSQAVAVPLVPSAGNAVVGSSTAPAIKTAVPNPNELVSQPSVMEVDFGSKSQISSAAYNDANPRCPECGGKFSDEGICTLCNYAEPVKKAQRDRQQKKVVRPAGFQLWLMNLSNEPKNASLIGYSFFGAFNLFALITIAAGILSTSILGALLATFAAFFLVFIWSAFFKTRQLAGDPEAGLGIFASLWNLLLFASRQMKWEHYDSSLRRRVIIDLRNQEVSDQTLPAVAGFKNAQVIDLQGCNIGDAGLKHLYGHHSLHCLVLKNTKVTTAAVANLQQALPRIWIWH